MAVFYFVIQGVTKKVPSIEIRPFVVNLRIIPLGIYLCEIVLLYFRRVTLFGRSGSYNYSAIHVQVNSIPKVYTVPHIIHYSHFQVLQLLLVLLSILLKSVS